MDTLLDLAPVFEEEEVTGLSESERHGTLRAYVESHEIHRRLRDVILAFVLFPLPDEPLPLLVTWIRGLREMEGATFTKFASMRAPLIAVPV